MLTLSQTERLVRRIGELLGQPGLEAQAAKLAQDYAEVGRATVRRLEQCSVMIDAGEELQAMQLAETPPPLLDLITVLSFRQAGEWREYCQKRGLPFVEPFYDKSVRQLNATYGKGIAGDHPFYRDYRRAVLKNEDEKALSILRVLARLNPTDQNVAQEHQRLADKALRVRLERLRHTMESGQAEAALNQMGEIEGSALSVPVANPVWQQAQLLRCRHMIEKAGYLRQRDEWMETEQVVEDIRTLANQNGLPLTPEDTARWNELESWTTGQRAAFVREQDFRRAFEALEYSVQSSEQQRGNSHHQTPAQLQSDLDSLNAKRQEASRFGDLDAALAGRCEEQCEWLRGRIRGAQTRKRRIAIAWAGFAAAVLAVGAFFGWNFLRARQLAADLGRLERQRRVGEAQSLLAGMPARFKPQLSPAISEADRFIAGELQLKQGCEQKLTALRAALGSDTNDPTEIERLRSECVVALGRLAAEFQLNATNEFATLDRRWQQQLGVLQPQHNTQFSTRLAQAEQLSGEQLNATNGPDAIRAALPGIQNLVKDLEHLRSQPFPLQQDLELRLVQLTNQVGTWAQALAQWDALLPAQPHSLEEHLERLRKLASSPLASQAQRTYIDEIDRLGLSQVALLGQLLLPGQPEAWETLTNLQPAPPTFRPETPTDAEKEAYLRLRDDPNMHDIYAYWLTTNASRNDNPLQSHAIFTRGLLSTNRSFQPVGLIYDFKKYPATLRFEQQTINTYDYSTVEKKGLTQESDAFERLGLRDLINPNNGNYQKSLIELLDRLNQDNDSSSLFRAFVALRLFEIAQLRPLEWGLQWTPSARKERQGLEDLRAQNLQSGDWMVLNQIMAYKDLQQFFADIKELSLEKQARFFYRLAQQAVEKGFEFAGYVDEKGAPVLAQTNQSSTELWGWGSRTRTATLLLKRSGAGGGWQVVEEPLRYSPLFGFLGDRRLLLDQTAKLIGYAPDATAASLPPLFATGL